MKNKLENEEKSPNLINEWEGMLDSHHLFTLKLSLLFIIS